MRPITLTLTAFGPYAASEVIDFRQLGDNPLFLINGATGAGKTTILDGICFALYGSTTGNEREPAQMRCDYAAADVITRVEFIFELAGNRYRICREPEQQKPKVRGEGTTTHAPIAEFVQLQGDEVRVLVARKVTEANQQVEELTGLNAAQFRQVMVLPQGEFRRLLLASSADREAIFSQLFQTQVYKRIEWALAEKAGGIRKAREASLNQQKGILDGAGMESAEQLSSQLKELAPSFEAAQKQKQQAQSAQKQANDALQAGKAIDAQQQQLSKAKKVLAELAGQAKVFDGLRLQREQAAVAERLKPLHKEWHRIVKQQQDNSRQQQDINKQLSKEQGTLDTAKAELAKATAQEPKIAEYTAEVSRLEAYRPRVLQLAQSQQTNTKASALAESANKELQIAKTAMLAVDKQLLQNAEQLKTCQQKLEGRDAASRALELANNRVQQAESAAEFHKQLEFLAARLKTGDERLVVSEQQCQQLQRQLKTLELAWHQGQAAILAADLQDQQPCPVCGSAEHPQLAIPASALPSQEQIETAKTALDAALAEKGKVEVKLAQAHERAKAIQEQLDAVQKEMGEQAKFSVELLKQQQAQASAVIADMEVLRQQEKTLLGEKNTLETQQKDAATACDQSATNKANADAALQVAQSNLKSAEAELPEKYRLAGALQKAIDVAVQSRDELQKTLEQAKQAVQLAVVAVEKCRTELQANERQAQQLELEQKAAHKSWLEALGASCFNDQAQFERARRTESDRQALQQKIERYDAASAEAQGAVKSFEQALADKPMPDLAALEQAFASQNQQLEAAEQAFASIDKQLSQLQRAHEQLQKAKQASEQLDKEYAVVGTLSDAANGRTGNRVSLQRFVLSVLLDDVLIAASERLKLMSKGRYSLYRQQQRAKGAGASGLELLVEDAYNGRQRPVATLSGGESFMAALSMALGLSDVVQAHSGGIQLDTLFIDEGFGSLDPESLDLAVNTLIDLQATGRMVGVISHVPELKERINVRLDVIADRAGSRTRVIA